MTTLRTALALCLAGSLLALGACSDDEPRPKIAPPETSSPTASQSTSEAPGQARPAMPAEAAQKSNAGAQAFVRYWVRIVNFSQATGDADALATLNARRCIGCRAVVKAISAAYKSGGHIDGGGWSIGRLRKLPPDHGADFGFYARGRIAPQDVVSGGSNKQTHSEGGSFQLYSYTSWRNRRWEMQWLGIPS